MQKTKSKGRGKNRAYLNKTQNASKTVLKQHITFEDGLANLVESYESPSSKFMKQIESELSERVVSLASFIGDSVVFECTGIFIENLCADATSILTSASIAGSSDCGSTGNLTIKVHLPSERVVIGWLHHHDSKCDLAVVNIRRVRGFQEVNLSSSHRVQFESNSKVVAVARCFSSGMLQSLEGILIGCANDETCEFMLPTYKIITAWIGYPLIDFDGNFVGLNLRYGERTAFLPVKKVLECLREPGTIRHTAADTNNKHISNSWSPICVDQVSEDVTFAREEDVHGRAMWC